MQITAIKKSPRQKVRDILDRLPNDEVFTTGELSEKTKIGTSTLRHMTLEFKENIYKMGTANMWGSKQAIINLSKHMNQEVK